LSRSLLAAALALTLIATPAAEARSHHKPRSTRVRLLAINDLHGHLQPNTPGHITLPDGTSVPAGGVAYLATHLKQLRRGAPHSLFVGQGDMVGASPLVSALFHDEPTIEALNLMHLRTTSVGNHEFDEGYRELLRLQDGGCNVDETDCDPDHPFAGADFQYLAANVVKESSGKPILPPYKIVRIAHERIGFIGVVTRTTPTIVVPSGVAGLKFLDEADTINKYVPRLQRRHVDAIVALIHEGGEQTGGINECKDFSGPIVDIAHRTSKAVDVLLTGHTHLSYNCRIDRRVVIEASSFGRVISDVDLTFDRRTRDLIAVAAKNVPVTQDVTPDPRLQALVDRFTALSAPLANSVVGTVTGDLTRTQTPAGESNLGDVIADSQLAATQTSGGAQIAFMNPGGIRTDILAAQSSGGEATGQVTYGEAFAVQPFGNSLITLTLTGAQIKAALEQQFDNPDPGQSRILQVSQGFTYSWDATRPAGSRVDPASIKLNGTPISATASYRVTVNSFLATGGDGFTTFTAGTNQTGGGQDIDAFVAYLGAHSPLSPPPTNRIARTG
jgi:5'-nucleotidase